MYDVGGPEVMTYREMIERVANLRGKRPFIVEAAVLTPRISRNRTSGRGLVSCVSLAGSPCTRLGLCVEKDGARRFRLEHVRAPQSPAT